MEVESRDFGGLTLSRLGLGLGLGLSMAGCRPGGFQDLPTGGSGTDDGSTDGGDSGSTDGGDSGSTDDGGTMECPASGSSIPGPPTLNGASFESQKVVRLSFTESLGSLDDVDPAAFRISYAFAYDYGPTQQYTQYYDPMLMLCLSSDYCIYNYVHVIDVACAPDDPAAMLLTLDVFHPYICQFLIDPNGTSPLLPHFDASISTVADLDGETLASISPDFVTTPDLALEIDGLFPNYPMQIPIECP